MTDQMRKRILIACFRFMQPIAHALLSNGINYREFDLVSRRAFVHAASKQFGVRGRDTNASRIAAMTGISRKQVQELRRVDQTQDERTEKRLSPIADMLHEWVTNSAFRTSDGALVALKLGRSRERSFDSLVRSCIGDVPPGAVKAELLRLGVATINDDGELELKRRSLIPEDAGVRLESAIAYSLSGLASTIARNINPDTPESSRYFERFVESHPLSISQIAELRSIIRSKLIEFSEELDVFVNDYPVCEAPEAGRIGVGLYYTDEG